ncbi:MAG: thioredoxin family protein [Gammaproteobacteria bacterium]|nr:thioredoxin family protein [Gammaproteobacteria bacterium]
MLTKKNYKYSYRALTFCLLFFIFFSQSGFAQVNKCKINGKTVYTDKACPDDTADTLDLSNSSFSTVPSPVPSGARNFTHTTSSSDKRVSSSGWLHDRSGYQKALKISAQRGAPIFIYGYTDWCSYCKKLQKGLFQDSSIKKVMSQFVKVKINPEHSKEDQNLFNKWGGSGYPTLYTQSNSAPSPKRTKGPFTRNNGKWHLMTKNEFIAMLESRL